MAGGAKSGHRTKPHAVETGAETTTGPKVADQGNGVDKRKRTKKEAGEDFKRSVVHAETAQGHTVRTREPRPASSDAEDTTRSEDIKHTTKHQGSSIGISGNLRVFRLNESTGITGYRMSRRWDLDFDPTLEWGAQAAYKRKKDKVQPVNKGDRKGTKPGGRHNWKELAWQRASRLPRQPILGAFDHLFTPRFSTATRGSRLTPARVQKLCIGDHLQPNERDLLVNLLYMREDTLAWDFKDLKRIHPDVAPPQVIRTIEHEAWQSAAFHVPKALDPIVMEMLRERLDAGILEYCHGPYRNPWFLVKKKSGKYRMINAAMFINKVTIRDANIPPNVEDFAEEFGGLPTVSLVDLQSGYDQIELDQGSRDLTGFMTPLGLLRNCTLPQGSTNAVAQFSRIMERVLDRLIPDVARAFLDDIGIKGPRSRYGDTEALPGIRRFILEHIMNIDKVLTNMELAQACISGEKSQFCQQRIRIVGYVCDEEGRKPDAAKVLKILDWPPCNSCTEVRGFLGICVYYRLWILDFAIIASPMYILLKKDVVFIWGPEQQEAMDVLKICLTSPPAIRSVDYSERAGEIILAADASLGGWGSTLMQQDTDSKRRFICRYDSGLWSDAERKYDAGKRECRGLLKALKKVRYYLYGVYFIIEIDAKTLAAQLNRSATDVPGAVVNQWLAWIRMFDFDVRHVPGKKHTAADSLSRKPWVPSDDLDTDPEDLDDFIDATLCCVTVQATGTIDSSLNLSTLDPGPGYTKEHQDIARYLTTLKRPAGLSTTEFRQFKNSALKYIVQDGYLFRRGGKNIPMRKVVVRKQDKLEIIHFQHDRSGHKGVESTSRRVSAIYWWDNMWSDVKDYCKTCEICQKRSKNQQQDTLHATSVATLFEKVSIDVVKMSPARGKQYLVLARENLSGWVEGRALSNATSETVSKFIWEDIICRHGCFGKLICDGGPENKAHVKYLAEKYGIQRIVVSAYNAPANGLSERGHQPIIDGLSKLAGSGHGDWVSNLHLVMWADRTTARVSTGETPYRLLYGYECVLPIETRIPTWTTLSWGKVVSTADLLAMRTRQLQQRDIDLDEASARIERMRNKSKEYWDDSHHAQDRVFRPGDLVLLYNSRYENDYSLNRKLAFWWLGPYRVWGATASKGTYTIEELDGTMKSGTVPGRRLKPFYSRDCSDEPDIRTNTTATNTSDSEADSESSEKDVPIPLQDYIPEGHDFAVVIPPHPLLERRRGIDAEDA